MGNVDKTFVDVDYFIGKTIAKIDKTVYQTEYKENDSLTFYLSDGSVYVMSHEPDCCEYVWLEDINGDLDDLVGAEILQAEVVTNHEDKKDGNSLDWTFYKFATIKGYVTLRWCCDSNGWYSTAVDIWEVK